VSGRQELITRRVSQVLGGAVDTTVTQWTTSHGDLHWGNITAPIIWDRFSARPATARPV
jgi:hypothetical protein